MIDDGCNQWCECLGVLGNWLSLPQSPGQKKTRKMFSSHYTVGDELVTLKELKCSYSIPYCSTLWL